MFYGRTKQIEAMNEKYTSDRKQFGVIYGRRRIGKTELVKAFLTGKEGIYFQALQATVYENLRAFSEKVTPLFSLPRGYVFASWEEALEAVETHFSGRRHFLVIDEYSFIASQYGAFSSIIQSFYDGAGDGLFMMLLGSDVSFLRAQITDIHSPLYMRRTFEINLGKMPLREALLFLDGLPSEEKCDYLSLMSTYPYYLSAIDKSRSFTDNLINLLFSDMGLFASLPDAVLSNSVDVPNVYNTILRSISRRHHTIKEISLDIREESAKVAKYLSTLLESEVVEKRETFMGNKRSSYYVIGDSLLRFWYLFVFPRQDDIRSNGKMVYESEKEEIRDFLCHGFEDTAILFLDEMNSEGKLGLLFPHVKNFRADGVEKLGRSVEIDGLAEAEGTLLVVECKYKNRPFDARMMEHLRESASIFADKLERQYYVFSKSGFSDDFEPSSDTHCFTAEDILKSG